jgi:HAD superfamily hydrolase (TIGR01509 family)
LIPFQAVIFDLDGLLLDTERIALAAFNETCGHFNIGDQKELFMRCVGANQSLGEKILMEGLPQTVDFTAFNSVWYENYRKRIHDTPVPLKDGAFSLLRYLSSRHISMAVATSSKTDRAVEKLQSSDILHMFKVVVGGDQVKHSKPHPDIFLRAAELMGVNPEKCLALEDSENGVRSAVAAGMTVIQIPDLVPPTQSLRGLGHTILESLSAVEAYLPKIDKG